MIAIVDDSLVLSAHAFFDFIVIVIHVAIGSDTSSFLWSFPRKVKMDFHVQLTLERNS